MNIKNATYAILSVVLTLLFCKQFTQMGTSTWYIDFNKPAITPPNYVFPIAWNILYILMGISFYKILNAPKRNTQAIKLYISQLVFQVLWCYVFFASQHFLVGLFILLIINVLAIKMISEFKKIAPSTFYMLLPYNIWIFFAFILNLCFII